jgi:hypothetical protein
MTKARRLCWTLRGQFINAFSENAIFATPDVTVMPAEGAVLMSG